MFKQSRHRTLFISIKDKREKRKEERENKGGCNKFFINVSDKIAGLAPTYLWVQFRTQGIRSSG